MTILVVDDHDDIRRIITHILKQHGFDVLTAADGASALKSVTEHRPDALVLDIMMPEMNGLEVLQHLRENAVTASIPVVLVTALSRDTELLAGYQAGGDYYITKPFTAQQILYAVKLVLARESKGTAPPDTVRAEAERDVASVVPMRRTV